MNQKLFSSTLKVLLNLSRVHKGEVTIETFKEALMDIYHPEMTIDDLITVTDRALQEALSVPEFGTKNPNELYMKIIKAPYKGFNRLGDIIYGPKAEDQFTVRDFYTSILKEYLSIFMTMNKHWCLAYLNYDNKNTIKLEANHDLEIISDDPDPEVDNLYYHVYKCKTCTQVFAYNNRLNVDLELAKLLSSEYPCKG